MKRIVASILFLLGVVLWGMFVGAAMLEQDHYCERNPELCIGR